MSAQSRALIEASQTLGAAYVAGLGILSTHTSPRSVIRWPGRDGVG